MPAIDPDSLAVIQPELGSTETVLWAGRPRPGICFHKEDILLIPFSIFWGGFSIFWEGAAAGVWGSRTVSPAQPFTFFTLFGVPFILIGQYLIWGRFVYAVWKKKRTYYAVTNRRVIVVQITTKRQVGSAFIDTLPTIIKEGRSNGIGILRFAQPQTPWNGGMYNWDPMPIAGTPTFMDIDDIDSVFRLISDLRQETAH